MVNREMAVAVLLPHGCMTRGRNGSACGAQNRDAARAKDVAAVCGYDDHWKWEGYWPPIQSIRGRRLLGRLQARVVLPHLRSGCELLRFLTHPQVGAAARIMPALAG
jgi:hypothetical protein